MSKQWNSGDVALLLGQIYNGTCRLEGDALADELYTALLWTYQEYVRRRNQVAEIRMIVAPDKIPTIDGAPFE